MRSMVRKDTGEDWEEDLRQLVAEEGIEGPTDEEICRFDKGRVKRASNQERESPTGADNRIAKIKGGTTHLAYRADITERKGRQYPRGGQTRGVAGGGDGEPATGQGGTSQATHEGAR